MKLRYILVISIVLFMFSLSANAKTVVSLQYSPSSDYKTVVGLGLYNLKDKGISFYGNIQGSVHSDDSFFYTYHDPRDPVVDRFKTMFLVNVGITKELSQYLGAYVGLGYGETEEKVEKKSDHALLSVSYYEDDPGGDSKGINVNGGLLISIKRLTLEIGGNTFTKNVYLGLGINF